MDDFHLCVFQFALSSALDLFLPAREAMTKGQLFDCSMRHPSLFCCKHPSRYFETLLDLCFTRGPDGGSTPDLLWMHDPVSRRCTGKQAGDWILAPGREARPAEERSSLTRFLWPFRVGKWIRPGASVALCLNGGPEK